VTWTYEGDPAASTRDAVRFRIGDTLEADPLVTDEEIAAAVADEGSVDAAAAACLEAIAARFSRQADLADGDVRISYSQRAEAFASRAAELRARAGRAGAVSPFGGGLASSCTDTSGSPAFTVGMHDNP